MKRIISIFLVVLLFISTLSSVAYADVNVKKMSDKELKKLYEQVIKEMRKRGLPLGEEITLREGMYVVGEDIQPGTYKITCTETEGEKMGGAYSSLGDAYSKLDGNDSWGSLFGSLGGMMEDVAPAIVEIVGDYGKVIKSYELKTGETMTITLEEDTALKVSDGSCVLEMR